MALWGPRTRLPTRGKGSRGGKGRQTGKQRAVVNEREDKPASKLEEEVEKEDAESEYEVDEILDHQWEKGKLQYYSSWVGYSAEHNCWISAASASSALESVDAYWLTLPASKQSERTIKPKLPRQPKSATKSVTPSLPVAGPSSTRSGSTSSKRNRTTEEKEEGMPSGGEEGAPPAKRTRRASGVAAREEEQEPVATAERKGKGVAARGSVEGGESRSRRGSRNGSRQGREIDPEAPGEGAVAVLQGGGTKVFEQRSATRSSRSAAQERREAAQGEASANDGEPSGKPKEEEEEDEESSKELKRIEKERKKLKKEQLRREKEERRANRRKEQAAKAERKAKRMEKREAKARRKALQAAEAPEEGGDVEMLFAGKGKGRAVEEDSDSDSTRGLTRDRNDDDEEDSYAEDEGDGDGESIEIIEEPSVAVDDKQAMPEDERALPVASQPPAAASVQHRRPTPTAKQSPPSRPVLPSAAAASAPHPTRFGAQQPAQPVAQALKRVETAQVVDVSGTVQGAPAEKDGEDYDGSAAAAQARFTTVKLVSAWEAEEIAAREATVAANAAKEAAISRIYADLKVEGYEYRPHFEKYRDVDDWEPLVERIFDVTRTTTGKIMVMVVWIEDSSHSWVSSSTARKKCPNKLIDLYERNLVFAPFEEGGSGAV